MIKKLNKKQRLIRATSWIYQSCNPDPKVKKALRIIQCSHQAKSIEVHGLSSVKEKIWWAKRILWDSSTNLVKQYRMANHYRYAKAHELIRFLTTHVRVVPQVPLFLYDSLITFKNCHLSWTTRGKPVILTPHGHDVVNMLKMIEARAKQWLKGDYTKRGKGQARIARNIMMFVNAIEVNIFKALIQNRTDIFNWHEHVMIASMQDLGLNVYDKHNHPKYAVWHDIMDYVNQYFDDNITVMIRPLMNKTTKTPVIVNRDTSDTDWHTIFYSTLYYLKQRTLPVPKNWTEYYALKQSPMKDVVVQAVLNSIPKSAHLRNVLNFKKRECKLNRALTEIILQVLRFSNQISSWGGYNFFLFLFEVTSYLNFKTNKHKPPP